MLPVEAMNSILKSITDGLTPIQSGCENIRELATHQIKPPVFVSGSKQSPVFVSIPKPIKYRVRGSQIITGMDLYIGLDLIDLPSIYNPDKFPPVTSALVVYRGFLGWCGYFS